jgi:hypothetical protein
MRRTQRPERPRLQVDQLRVAICIALNVRMHTVTLLPH